jgi:hypothetical protein
MATAPIGHNNPPAPTAYEAIDAHVTDLETEARNHLDGKPIENQAQADAVSKLLDEARKALQAAEDRRMEEARPWNEGKAAVQALWTPITDEKKGRCALIIQTAKNALAAFLSDQEAAMRAAAEAARQEANRQAEAAAQAAQQARPDDLAGQTTARVLQENAAAAAKAAEKAEKARPQAKGGERAVSLRTNWVAEIVDPAPFARWVWTTRRGEMLTFLETVAAREAKQGPRDIPGLKITNDPKAA